MKEEYVVIIIFAMLLGHVLAEYCLQGTMAQMKQKQFWKNMYVGGIPRMECITPDKADKETDNIAQEITKAMQEAHKKAEDAWENHPSRYDYIPPMICHSFMWATVVGIAPTVWLIVGGLKEWWVMIVLVIANTALHATIDDAGTNAGTITLVEEHLWYLGQIVVTFCVCLLITFLG